MLSFPQLLLGALVFAALLGVYKYFEASAKAAHKRHETELRDAEAEAAFRNFFRTAAASLVEAQGKILQILESGNGSIAALTAAVGALGETMTKAQPSLEKIGDDAFLMAKGVRDMSDNIVALRAVVYGGRRAEDFPVTINDDERTRRADMEYDVQQLMVDHGLSRSEAASRVRDTYAGRRAG